VRCGHSFALQSSENKHYYIHTSDLPNEDAHSVEVNMLETPTFFKFKYFGSYQEHEDTDNYKNYDIVCF